MFSMSDSDNPRSGHVDFKSHGAMKIFCRRPNCKEATIATIIWCDRSVLFLRDSHLASKIDLMNIKERYGFSLPRGNRLDRKLDVLGVTWESFVWIKSRSSNFFLQLRIFFVPITHITTSFRNRKYIYIYILHFR